MELIADILLVAGALGLGFYCFVLARRLGRFNDLEKGVGGAVAVLSDRVDELTKTLGSAQATAGASALSLEKLTGRAETMSQRLELHLASLNDIAQVEEIPKHPISEFPVETDVGEPDKAEPVFKRHAKGRPQ